ICFAVQRRRCAQRTAWLMRTAQVALIRLDKAAAPPVWSRRHRRSGHFQGARRACVRPPDQNRSRYAPIRFFPAPCGSAPACGAPETLPYSSSKKFRGMYVEPGTRLQDRRFSRLRNRDRQFKAPLCDKAIRAFAESPRHPQPISPVRRKKTRAARCAPAQLCQTDADGSVRAYLCRNCPLLNENRAYARQTGAAAYRESAAYRALNSSAALQPLESNRKPLWIPRLQARQQAICGIIPGEFRQLTRTAQRRGMHKIRRINFGIAVFACMHIQHEVRERAMQPRERPAQH